ncbi:hypothetical protein SNEBB_004506 [Seison nebaliae]|nr:hypothetical protein SNEBB_004506 [Seison nebaliae]
MIFLVYIICLFASALATEYDVLMPGAVPKFHDHYMCTAKELDISRPMYVTGFIPRATMETAHHILLFSCEDKPTDLDIWTCGEMRRKTEEKASTPVCKGKSRIIYAWAMDAPKLELPKNVAFRLGDADSKYIVMQVHYKVPFKPGYKDHSGITLNYQLTPVPRTADVYLLATGGRMGPTSEEYFESACEWKDKDVIPFAYRTHAHSHGIVNSGYRVRENADGYYDWKEIGRRSPQLPQMFYPASNNMTIREGDVVAARCTMYNNENRVISIGSTRDDEMCNFYIMVHFEGNRPLSQHVCGAQGPPYYYFKDLISDFSPYDLPDDISVEPPKVPE